MGCFCKRWEGNNVTSGSVHIQWGSTCYTHNKHKRPVLTILQALCVYKLHLFFGKEKQRITERRADPQRCCGQAPWSDRLCPSECTSTLYIQSYVVCVIYCWYCLWYCVTQCCQHLLLNTNCMLVHVHVHVVVHCIETL